jgi:hypothetical protein
MFMIKLLSLITKTFMLGIMSISLLTANVYAATVTPAPSMDSLSTPYYYMNVKACVEQFNWEQYTADQKAGVQFSAPYTQKGCVRQEAFASNGSKTVTKNAQDNITSVDYTTGAMKINTPLYKNFNGNNNTEAKAILGDLPVIGITPNGGFAAQSTTAYDLGGTVAAQKTACDRVLVESMLQNECIWSNNELNLIYGPQTARTGAPRIVQTGVDQITVNPTTNKKTHDGGPCYTANGKAVVRSKIAVGTPEERNATPTYATSDVNSPIDSCRFFFSQASGSSVEVNCGTEALRPGTTKTYMVIDQGICATQFIYVFQIPTKEQCKTLWDIPFTDYEIECKQYWQKRLGGLHNNNATGEKFIAVYTYYGMYADSSFKCQTIGQTNCGSSYRYSADGEWRNPDKNGPRKNFATTATKAQLQEFFNDTTLTYDQLKIKYNGLIQSYDGASTYVI